MQDAFTRELKHETQYDCNALKELIQMKIMLLNQQQKYAYDTLMKIMIDETGDIFSFDAPGGTGKFFLITLILATFSSQNDIILALA